MMWHGDHSFEDPGIVCPGPDLARQEHLADADINTFLKRYGAPPVRPPGGFQESDQTQGLFDAYLSVWKARSAFGRLPGSARAKFGTWQELMAAAARGEVDVVDGVVVEKGVSAAGGSPPAAGAPGQPEGGSTQ